jgi:hypothetical protein
MKYSGPIAIVLFVFHLCLTPFSSAQVNPEALRFDVFAHDRNLSLEVRGILESSFHKMSEFLEDTATGIITVHVVDTEDEFISLVGRNFPDWGIACAIPHRDLIILKSPLKFEYQRPFSQVVTHELAHILLGRFSRGARIPRWLDEGFAMYHSQEWRIGQDIAVARAVLTGSTLPLSQIESMNAFKESQAQLAYTESFLAISYLYREYGEGTVQELVSHLAEGNSLDAAFLKTIGSNYLSFQLEFGKYIETEYNWTSILGDTLVIWIGLAFLFIFLYFLKMRRAHKTLKRWKQEESREINDELSQDQTQD